MFLTGINADDTLSVANEHQPGYYPTLDTIDTVTTAAWTNTADGTPLYDFNRLGVVVASTSRHPALTSHKLYWIRAEVEYVEGGPVVDTVTGVVNWGDPISWTASSGAGLPFTHYEIMVIRGSAQDPTVATLAPDITNPSTGEYFIHTDLVPDPLIRSVTFDDQPLARASMTYAVRMWARLPSGALIASDWNSASSNPAGTPVVTPDQNTEPVLNATTGAVDLSLTTSAGQTRAWVSRSIDSGATYQLVPESPYTLLDNTADQAVSDNWCPAWDHHRSLQGSPSTMGPTKRLEPRSRSAPAPTSRPSTPAGT